MKKPLPRLDIGDLRRPETFVIVDTPPAADPPLRTGVSPA
jgi:hypothetical protein